MTIPRNILAILDEHAGDLAPSQYARAILDAESAQIREFIKSGASGLLVLKKYAGGNGMLKHPRTDNIDLVLPRELNSLYKQLGKRSGFGRSGLIRWVLADHCFHRHNGSSVHTS